MIVATIITYNDWPLIKECVESVYGKVNKIIIVDGRFKDFPKEDDYSNGEGLKYFLELSKNDKFEIISTGGFTEIEKRNIYLKHLKNGDICLNIDSDEMLIGEIPKLIADIGIIQVGEQGDRKRHRRTNRFFKFGEGLHYWGKHSLILDKDNKVFANLDKIGEGYTNQKIIEFELLHRNDLRIDKRKKNKKKYYQILMKREAKINGANFS